MEHELIDWYDKKVKHKGVIDKAIAHKKGLWHKSVHVWIVNDKNQILLQKRCANKNFFPNVWDCSFAGHVGANETSLISAIREGKEELGLMIKSEELEYLFTVKEKLKWKNIISKEFVDVYIMHKNIDLSDLKYQKEEVENAKYFEMNEVLSGNEKDVLHHIEEYKLLEKVLK